MLEAAPATLISMMLVASCLLLGCFVSPCRIGAHLMGSHISVVSCMLGHGSFLSKLSATGKQLCSAKWAAW
jgi:hypothetical protein